MIELIKEVVIMTLLKQKSDRLDNRGIPFIDVYLGWRYEGHVYLLRVKPHFGRDYALMFSHALEVPYGETLEKYVD